MTLLSGALRGPGGLSRVVVPAAVLLASLLILYPLVMLAIGSFAWRPFPDGGSGYPSAMREVLQHGRLFGNTLLVGFGSTTLALVVGTCLAWVLVRTDVPLQGLLTQLVTLPFYLSPLIGAIGWAILASPGEVGFVNRLLIDAFGWAPFNIYSPAGIMWVLGLHFAPFCFLLVAPALRSIDAPNEEAARVFGGTPWQVITGITLPLLFPSIAASGLLIFVQSIGQFGVPAMLGMPYHFDVVATAIYENVTGLQPDYARAARLGFGLFAICLAAIFVLSRIWRRRGFAVVTGRASRAATLTLGRARVPVLCCVLIYLAAAVVLPIGALAWASMLKFMTSALDQAQYTVDNFKYVLIDYPTTRLAMRNTAIVAMGGATFTLLLGAVLSWKIYRDRNRGYQLVEYLVFVPLAVPGIVFSLGLLWAWIRFPLFQIYGTLWIILICYVTLFLPLAVRAVGSSLQQIDRSLEEAARVSGASPGQVLRTITGPLLASALAATWVILLVSMVKELSASALLSNSRTIVLSVAIFDLLSSGSFTVMAALALVETVLLLLLFAMARRFGAMSFAVRA